MQVKAAKYSQLNVFVKDWSAVSIREYVSVNSLLPVFHMDSPRGLLLGAVVR